MTTIDIDAVRNWLEQLPGGSLAQGYASDWDAFEKLDRPVVTLFGSYDTGKSSLLRRLLVDSRIPVPDWLTISARHETFEVNEVEIGDCLVRDTPGFAVGASDMRGQNNTRRAMAAVGLTDVGLVVLTPQLATAEHETLQRVVAQEWPAGALLFVISRFDEAGANPEHDLDGYRNLSDRKVQELREMFKLDDTATVFVVSQDPFQRVGPDSDVDRDEWDSYRSWDGIGALAKAVDTLSTASLPEWRRAAGQRYWTTVVTDVLAELRVQLPEYQSRAEVSASGVAQRDAWMSELDALDRAANASLDGLVDEVVRRSGSGSGNGTKDLQDEIQRSLDQWFTKHEARLRRLQQSISKASERNRDRPSWDGFASLLETLDAPGDCEEGEGPGAARHVEQVGVMLIDLLKAVNRDAGPVGNGRSKPTVRDGKWGRHIGMAEAALPLAVYVTTVVAGQVAGRAQAAEGKAAVERREQAVAECTHRARDEWAPFVDDVRALIVDKTNDQVSLNEGLCRVVEQLQEAVTEGEILLRDGRPSRMKLEV